MCVASHVRGLSTCHLETSCTPPVLPESVHIRGLYKCLQRLFLPPARGRKGVPISCRLCRVSLRDRFVNTRLAILYAVEHTQRFFSMHPDGFL